MKIGKLKVKIITILSIILIISSCFVPSAYAFTLENKISSLDDVKIDIKQIKEIANPNISILQAGDSRDGTISQSLAATVASAVNNDSGWTINTSANVILRWLYPNDTDEQLKSENISAEQAVEWLNSIGYTASIVDRSLTTDEIKTSLDKSSPIITIFESQNSDNWLEKTTTGILYAHDDVDAGDQKLHQSFVKTAYHDELYIEDGKEANPFKFSDQYDNPNSMVANSEYKWVKSITDIKKDPSWESRQQIVANRASGVLNANIEKSGNTVTSVRFTDDDVLSLYRKYPVTNQITDSKLAAVSLINLYFDEQHQKTVGELESFANISANQEVTGDQIVSWYQALGFSCDTSSGRLTKDLTKSINSAGKLYLTTYKATISNSSIPQIASVGTGFSDNGFGYSPTLGSIREGMNISVSYNWNWNQANAADKYFKACKEFNYDNFSLVNLNEEKTLDDYQSDLTIYNIRQKDAPEADNPQFPLTHSETQAPERVASYNTNSNFGVRETQAQQPWCSAYVNAAAINTFKKATDTPTTSAKELMQLFRPNASEEELNSMNAESVEDCINKIKSNYNVGVTFVNKALSFSEVKSELDAGQIIQMDAYNVNATNDEEKYGHAFAIVGYVMPSDGDQNKSPYYEIWNPWWQKTFFIPSNSETFRVGGIDYKWNRTWYNWRQDGAVSMDQSAKNQQVASMSNPDVSTQNYDFDSISLLNNNNSLNVSKQKVSEFGRETSTFSLLHQDTFGYAFTNDYARSLQRSRHNAQTTQNYSNSIVATEFREDVNYMNQAYNDLKNVGITGAVLLAVWVVAQFLPGFGEGIDAILSALGVIGIGSGGAVSVYNLAKAIYHYLQAETSIRINYVNCVSKD